MQKFTFSSTIILAIFAAITAAIPTPQATSAPTTVPVGYVVRLKCNDVEESGASPVTISSVPIGAEINVLTEVFNDGISSAECTNIEFTGETALGVDLDIIECRAYSDLNGTTPGSAPFTLANPAEIATPGNGREIGSVLCYVV